MSRSFVVAIVVAGLAFALLVPASPAGAAKTKDPCKTLKETEIAAAFGGATVAAGQKRSPTPITPLCQWTVSASGNLPEGTVSVFLQTTGAKTAYDAHKKDTATYEKVAGLKNALYFSEGPAVEVLKGKVLVNVQGVFLEEISTDAVDVKAQLVQLAKKAAPRV
jgi:hypothetical protein